ncbi:MAG: nucleotidyltransferase family protein, partial [bacterium]
MEHHHKIIPEVDYLVKIAKASYTGSQDLPDLSPGTMDEEKTANAILKLAEKNSVSYIVSQGLVKHADKIGLSDTSKEKAGEVLQENKRLYESTLAKVESVTKLFPEDRLPVLFIKSFRPFPYADGDVDVVAVDESQTANYRKILDENGFRYFWNLSNIREPDKYFYSNGQKPNVHLHKKISWNGIAYLDSRQVWERRSVEKRDKLEFYVPSKEDEVLIMAAHLVFENKYISLDDLLYLRHLASQPLQWEYVFSAARRYHWEKGLVFFLQSVLELGRIFSIDLANISTGMKNSSHKFHSSTQFQLESTIILPYFYEILKWLGIETSKFFADILKMRIGHFARQIFTYYLVDIAWLYRRNRRLKRRITNRD